MAITTNGLQLARLAGAAFNQQLSASDYSEILAANKTAAELDAWANAAVASEFRNKTTTDIAKAVLANVGLSSVAGLEAWVAGQLTAGGGVAKAGANLMAMLNDFSNMTADATYGAAATTFNQKATNSQALSQTAGTATGTYAAVSTATPSTPFTLTTGVDLKTTGAGADTFTSVNPASATATLTAGDNIDGGAGVDTLAITSTAAMALGAGVTTTGIENVSVSASGGALTLDTAQMTGITSVANSGSSSDVSITGLKALVPVSVTATSAATTVGFASAVTAGTADAITVNINGVGTSVITANGFETINVASSGSASGGTVAATNGTTVASTTLNTLNVTGTAAAKLVANLVGANAATTGTVTSDDGAHDVDISGRALTDKLSVTMLGGNDTVRVDTVSATHTIAGGDGTDTLRYSGNAVVALAATANVSGIETVTLAGTAPASFAMTGAGVTTVNYSEAGAGTFGGLSTGGTVNLNKGGSVTVAAAGAAATATAAATLTAATYSGTADSLTVNVGTALTTAAASTVSAVGVESVTFNSLAASGSVEPRTIAFTDTTATTAALKSITVNSSIQGLTTVSVTNPNTTVANTSALSTVNLAGVAGGATFTGGAAAGTAITGGSGIDSLTGAAGPDVIIGGDGNDFLIGLQGADTLTGGAGVDTFTIAANSAVVGAAQTSGATLTDTITDFVSGTDKLNLAQATSFLGNFANFTAGAAATAGSGAGANQAFYSVADSTVYVLASTTGALAATDTMVKLSNAPATLAAGDLNFGSGGNTITLTVAGSTVATGTATTNTSTYNDIINSTAAFLVGSSIDGGVGSGDTLNITDAAPTIIFALNAAGNSINNIEIINLNLGSTGTVTTPAMGAANLTINNAHASNASTVVLGTGTGTTVFTSSSTGIDTVTVGATGQSVSTGGGDDVVNVTLIASIQGGTYNGGAGTNDVLNLVMTGADSGIVLGSTAVASGTAAVTGFEVINVTINNTADVVTITPDAAVTVNFVGAIAGDITVTGTGGAVTANAAATQQITVNGTGNVTVGGTNTTGEIIFSATKTAGTNSVTDSANAHTITNSSAISVSVNSTAQTGVTTLAGTGAGGFVVSNLIAIGGIITSTTTGPVTVTGTAAAAHTVTGGAGIDTVTISAGAVAQTIDTNGGNDIVTFTTTAGGVVTLGAGNDTFVAGTAATTVTGGLGSDSMTGGTAADVFIYSALDSSGVTTDTITGLNFSADFIRINTTLLATAFDASTASATTIGYSNFNVATGAITVQTTEGTMTVNTASSTNTPASSGSLQTASAIQYNIIGSNGADTILTGSGADTITGGIGADTMTGGAGADSFVISIIGSGTAVIDRIMDFVGGTDSLNLPVAGTGTINIGSTGADVSIATTLATSTGTSEANLLTDLNIAATARQTASAGLYAQTGDTFQVLITGVSLLGTNVTYVVQEVGGIATTVTTDDIIIGLVGTSTGSISVLTIT
jgi:Ca2+-binding RTX toxin-like protein